jgi:glutamate 5-kinase
VLKLGSAILIDEYGSPDATFIKGVVSDIQRLREQNKQVTIVCSGSVALGRQILGYADSKLKLEEKQAAAATGQPLLVRAWEEALREFDIPVAQALLTFYDTETRRRWLNARATLNTLLDAGAVPIVNENDTVATEELRYGDNDRLGARVAQMIGADVLVLLSDIDGLYTSDPRQDPSANHIATVTEFTDEILAMGGDANSQAGVGSGGMATKLEAAKIAMMAGCTTIITRGKQTDTEQQNTPPIAALLNGARATCFLPSLTPETARIQWLQGALNPRGRLTIDSGACRALLNGKSLLHVGVTHVDGDFERGDAVDVLDQEQNLIARGISAYSADDARRLMGHNSTEIENIVGYKGRPALVHKNDLVQL